jgi:hypothetical protein
MIHIGIEVTPDLGDFVEGLRKDIEGRISSGFKSVLAAAESGAKERAPSHTGRLRQSIRAFLDAPLRGCLVSGAPYSSFLHEGTGLYGPRKRPITIGPKKKDALAWQGAGHPVRKVVQRGIRPVDFIRDALNEALLKKAFEQGLETQVRK